MTGRQRFVLEQVAKLVREWKDEPYARWRPEHYLDLIDDLLKTTRLDVPDSYEGFRSMKMWIPLHRRNGEWVRIKDRGSAFYVPELLTFEECMKLVGEYKAMHPSMAVKVSRAPELFKKDE